MKIGFSLVLLSPLFTSGYAVEYVVTKGETYSTTITLAYDGDSARVEEGGILNPAVNGVEMNANNQTALNQGTISVGSIGTGILSIGGNNVITNTGQIDAQFGISSSGANAVITNSGQISITPFNGSGIYSTGTAVITNSGNIILYGSGTNGVQSSSNDSVLINSGQILGFAATHNGMLNSGSNVVMKNSGFISVDYQALSNTGDNVNIINSGTLIANDAVYVTGLDTTLTLLRGSNLQGGVTSIGGPLNLNVETGLNLLLTLDSSSNTFNNLDIQAPYVRVGKTVAVIDPTGLTLQADVTADISDTILDGIYRHRLGCCNPCGYGLWMQAIGSYRKRAHDSNRVGYDEWQGGFLAGYDTYFCGGNAALFGGISFGEAEVDEQTQKASPTTHFAGLTYENTFCNTFVGFAATLGYVNWDNNRYVMNNLAPNGVETAHFNAKGAFVSSEVSVAQPIWHSITSFTFRYAGLFLGDYHERGSSADLSVKNREIDLLTTRFELSFPYSDTCNCFCWSFEPYVGVFGRYQVGGNQVSGELLGQSIKFNQEGPRNLAALLLGFRGSQSFGCFNLFLNLECSFDNYDSSRILGEGGIGWNF